MNANHDLERRIADFYAAEPPARAPDWVLRSALATIDTTAQRRTLGRVPWRLPNMNSVAKLAVTAVAVIAVGLVGLTVLRPGSSPGPGGPGPTPSPTLAPTASPTRSQTSSAYVPPALTKTFTSHIHGISISYPAGWIAQPATAPWTTPVDPVFLDTTGDFLSDPARDGGHLFVMLASQPLSSSFDAWLAAALGDCTRSEPVVVDGAEGVLATGCSLAYVPSGGRVYLIRLYTSNDDPDLQAFNADVWLKEILATVQLKPQDAIDTVPSASP